MDLYSILLARMGGAGQPGTESEVNEALIELIVKAGLIDDASECETETVRETLDFINSKIDTINLLYKKEVKNAVLFEGKANFEYNEDEGASIAAVETDIKKFIVGRTYEVKIGDDTYTIEALDEYLADDLENGRISLFIEDDELQIFAINQSEYYSGEKSVSIIGDDIIQTKVNSDHLALEPFIAVYDVTTYEEVTEAFRSGRSVLCAYGGAYLIPLDITTVDNSVYFFRYFDLNPINNKMIYRAVSLSYENYWDQADGNGKVYQLTEAD